MPSPAPEAAPLRGPDRLESLSSTLSLPFASDSSLDGSPSPLLLSMLLTAGSLALVLFLLIAAPRHSLARVSYQLAQRRYDYGLVGAVMLIAVAVGYFIALWVG